MRELIKLFGIMLLLGIFFVMVITFLTAYFSPVKAVLVTINTKGEANLELFVILPFVAFFGLWGAILCFVDYLKEEKNENNFYKKMCKVWKTSKKSI